MSDHVTITGTSDPQKASFETINAHQSQMVFWKNNDAVAHWPLFSTGTPPPSLPFQVGPKANSDSLQPATALAAFYPAAGPLPITQGVAVPVTYGCKIHSGESGTINVYADFYSQPNNLAPAVRGTPYTANLTTGGLPPYTFQISNSNLPASLTLKNVAGQGPVLSGTPQPGDAGSFAFDLVCEDSDQNNVTQTYLLTVS